MSYFDDVIEPRIIKDTYYTKGRKMAYQQKEGDIVIYKVKEKKNEKGPDWTGKALIDGKEKDVSLWFKSETMLAGSVKPKYVPDFKSVQNKVSAAKTYHKPIEDEQEVPF